MQLLPHLHHGKRGGPLKKGKSGVELNLYRERGRADREIKGREYMEISGLEAGEE